MAAMFTRALQRTGIPVVGVSFPDLNDRSTWVIHFALEATRAQRDAGNALITTYDAALDTAFFDERALDAVERHPLLVAVGLALYTTLLGRPPTDQEKAALFALAKTIYQTLVTGG